MPKEYKCICGKTYTNAQSFNAHKKGCKIHLTKFGKLEKMAEINKQSSAKAAITRKKHTQQKRKLELEKWIQEKHICEKCGKIMTEKYGSGRFCSAHCASSRSHSDESRIKISETLRGRNLTEEEKIKLLTPKQIKPKIIYDGPELPQLKQEKLNPGYYPRTRMSYPEQFWKQVLDNNQIEYQQEYIVHKNKDEMGVYKLDFLIENFDIEIDGSQHYEDEEIQLKDIKRDEYLKSLGYIVYRIKWINPNTNENKIKVNQQIENLFNFLNKERSQ